MPVGGPGVDRLRGELGLRVVLAAFVVSLGGLFAYRVWGLAAEARREQAARAPKSITTAGTLPADEQQTVDLFDNAVPAIVYVRTVTDTKGPWFEEPRVGVVSGATGFVWESNYVVTSYHVVSDVLSDPSGSRRLIVQ